MKLSSALAIIIIAFQRHGCNIWASAEDQEHERELLLNQADAAKRVDDIVDAAMALADAGNINGVAIPLNYVVVNQGQGHEQQLTVALRLPGVERYQHVLVDTGSSSLAFCDKSLIEEAVNITKTDFAQCNKYAGGTCPNDPFAGDTFYVGQIFQGNISAFNTNSDEEIASMDEAYFAIMSRAQMSVCVGPLDGIIGLAYSSENSVVKIPSPDFNVSTLWHESCEHDDPYYKSVGSCSTRNLPSGILPAPLKKSLWQDAESGYISSKAFGLYCDYAATIGSKQETIVPSLGIFFGGDLALNNTFYNSGFHQVATVPPCGNEYEVYMLILKTIRVPGLNMTHSGFEQCNQCSNCITDSGDSFLWIPLPQSQCDGLTKTDVDTLKKMGSMLIDIEGVNGTTVTLSLPLIWLSEQYFFGNVVCTGTTGQFTLGFPIFQYYYLAYDMGSGTVTFVDLPQSNDTTAFIDGTELGGTNESSSGHPTDAFEDEVEHESSSTHDALIDEPVLGETKANEEPSSGYHYRVYTTRNLMTVFIGFLLLEIQ